MNNTYSDLRSFINNFDFGQFGNLNWNIGQTTSFSSIVIPNNTPNIHLIGEKIVSTIIGGINDIKLENCYIPAGNDNVYLNTNSGDIRLSVGELPCDARANSGDISCENIRVGNLRCTSGDVSLENATAKNISTTSGNIKSVVPPRIH